MAEIAEDCEMSAANIYRFFKGKDDILADIALFLLDEVESKLQLIVQSPQQSASEKLRLLMREALAINYDQYANQPKINESLENICNRRHDLIIEYRRVKHKLISAILREGINSGEFQIQDPDNRALAIIHATMAFHSPFFISTYSIEELASFSDNVIRALVTGLYNENVNGAL
jgi:AcrR family transcriptional regulator